MPTPPAWSSPPRRATTTAAGSSRPPGTAREDIAVAATNQSGQKASFSNFGGYVAIAAPGAERALDVRLHTQLHRAGTPSDTAYGYLSGTSMATPFVSAAAALIKEECPSFGPDQIKAELVNHAGRGRARVRVPQPRRRPGRRRRLPADQPGGTAGRSPSVHTERSIRSAMRQPAGVRTSRSWYSPPTKKMPRDPSGFVVTIGL